MEAASGSRVNDDVRRRGRERKRSEVWRGNGGGGIRNVSRHGVFCTKIVCLGGRPGAVRRAIGRPAEMGGPCVILAVALVLLGRGPGGGDSRASYKSIKHKKTYIFFKFLVLEFPTGIYPNGGRL